MGVDLDAWREQHEPWFIRLKGRTYEAAPVSVLTVLAFQQEVDAMKASGDTRGYDAAVERLLREAFPYRWRMLVPWVGDPVRRIMAMGPEAVQEVLRDFFVWTGTRWSQQQTPTTLRGNVSESKTPPPPTAAAVGAP